MVNKIHFMNNQWVAGSGSTLTSLNPATGKVIWEGAVATRQEIDQAIQAARNAFGEWAWLPLEERIVFLEAFRTKLEEHKEALAECISQEVGKPLWDARTEVGAMIGKIAISIDAYHHRTGTTAKTVPQGTSIIQHKPHGVIAVFGPYNFPGHLPNGHIVPALLAGNTVVFKPSEWTPLVAQKTMECWQEADLPTGVLNLIQGARETGMGLANHQDIDGLFFTGSSATGNSLHRQFGGKPEKILALEMGGNNPLIVAEASDKEAAAYTTIQSAFITSGQRCTCARRLIVPIGAEGDAFIEKTIQMIKTLKVGAYTETPEPFMGPVISTTVAQTLMETQSRLIKQGGKSLVAMKQLRENAPFLSPGLMDVTAIPEREDAEYFGPFLQLIRVDTFEEAIEEANRTTFGLSAGLLSDNEKLYQLFFQRIRAGIVNWNRPLTGASSNAPFGGIGASGNHFPSAYYAADYCSFPVASLESDQLSLPAQLAPGLYL